MNKFDDLVQDYARDPVPDDHTYSGWRIAIILVGVAITVPAFLIGAEIGQSMGVLEAAKVFLVSGLIIALIGCFAGAAASRSRLSTAMIIQFSFGRKGAVIVNLVIATALFGWFGVTVEVFADASKAALFDLFEIDTSKNLLLLLGGAIMTITTVFGFKALDRLSLLAVPMLLVFMLAVVYRVSEVTTLTDLINAGRHDLSFGTAVSAAVGGYMVGVTILPDMCRYAKGPNQAMVAAALGFGIGYPLVLFLAAVPSLVIGTSDFMSIVIGLGMGATALFVLVFATWTSNASNLYSNSLTIAAVLPRFPKWKIALAAGFAGTLLGFIGIMSFFVPFLVFLGTFIPPISGIYIADFYFVRGKHYNVPDIEKSKAISWPAFVSWIGGFGAAMVTAKEFITLSGIPALDSILVSFFLYLAIVRGVEKLSQKR